MTETLEKFSLRSPIAGTVVATHMTPGALVEAGQDLFTIMDLERVWIEGRLFAPDIPKVRNVGLARFAAPALSTPLTLSAPDAHLVTIGSVIDPATRSAPLTAPSVTVIPKPTAWLHKRHMRPERSASLEFSVAQDRLAQTRLK